MFADTEKVCWILNIYGRMFQNVVYSSKLPNPFGKPSIDKEEDNKDEHNGKTRNFPHERGNWATYVYVQCKWWFSISKVRSFANFHCLHRSEHGFGHETTTWAAESYQINHYIWIRPDAQNRWAAPEPHSNRCSTAPLDRWICTERGTKFEKYKPVIFYNIWVQ